MPEQSDAERLKRMQAVVSNLQNTLGKMEIVLGSINEAIVYTDKNGTIQWCNSAFDRLVDRSHLMVLGQSLPGLLKLEASDKELNESEHPLEVLRDQGRMTNASYSFTSREDHLWLEVSGNIISVEGEEIYIFLIQDVTELKLSRDQLETANIYLESRIQERTEKLTELSNRYQAILDCAVDAIITIDENGTIISLNPAVERMFGYTNQDILGKNINIIIPEPHHRRHNGYIKRFIQTGESRIIGKGREVVGVKSDGQLFPLHLSLSEVAMEGQMLFTGILRDISRQKEIIEDLETARKEAIEASRAKSEFLARMSHELRTPLNAILGMADLLTESDLSEEQLKFVSVSKGSGDHLLNIIDDLLDISRIEAGKLVLDNGIIDLHELVEVVLAIGRTAAALKSVEVRSTISDQVPQFISGDSKRLRQILINLVGNSVKFTDSGAVDINIAVKNEAASADSVQLLFEVVDTGIGIGPNVLKTIFESFAQAEPHINRKYGGSGLGLAISKNLVQMMGGEITVRSDVGQGSTFSFTAQFEKVDSGEILAGGKVVCSKKKKQSGEITDFSKSLSILLAEDSPDNRMLFNAYLSPFNCSLDIAENGIEAYDRYRDNDYDIVLMDVQMPEMDGYTATRKIRDYEKQNQLPEIPVVALTAHAQESDRDASFEAGCTQHIVKPVAKQVLINAIAALTEEQPMMSVESHAVYVDKDIEALIPMFLENRSADIIKLREAVLQNDFSTVQKLGHMLKGMGGGYGFNFITDIGRELEISGKESDSAKAKELTSRMESMLDNVEIIYTETE